MRIKTYFACLLVCLVVLGIAYPWPTFPWHEWPAIVLLIALAVLAESLAFQLPAGGTVSLTFALYVAGLLYAGPLPAAAMALFGAVPPQDFREHKPVFRMAFNVVMLCLSVLVAGVVFIALGGEPLVYLHGSTTIAPSLLVPFLLAALVFHLLNTALFSIVVALSAGVSVLSVWRDQNLAAYLASFAVLALLGFGMAQLLAVAGWSGAALMVIPFGVARQTFQVYRQLADAFSETIRSFVTAIEAKDPYTRGHSERVALYSTAIATEIGLKGRALERVEFAALLHDVGKIGVSKEVLTKATSLSAEEYEQIRRHPEVGCAILGEVDFLGEIVPIVRAHHEHMDGRGYPDGRTDDSIPLESRVLAVADAYDAMTSDRPYRRALDKDDALRELKRVADSQLDGRLVAAFVAMELPQTKEADQ